MTPHEMEAKAAELAGPHSRVCIMAEEDPTNLCRCICYFESRNAAILAALQAVDEAAEMRGRKAGYDASVVDDIKRIVRGSIAAAEARGEAAGAARVREALGATVGTAGGEEYARMRIRPTFAVSIWRSDVSARFWAALTGKDAIGPDYRYITSTSFISGLPPKGWRRLKFTADIHDKYICHFDEEVEDGPIGLCGQEVDDGE